MNTSLTNEQRERIGHLDFEAFVAYFEQIVAHFNLLQSFLYIDIMDWQQFENQLRGNKLPGPLLVLEDPTYSTRSGGAASAQIAMECAFATLAPYDPRKQPSQYKFINYMLYINSQVRAKMQIDKQQACGIMARLEIASLQTEATDRIVEWWGHRTTFRLIAEAPSALDPSEWQYLPFNTI